MTAERGVTKRAKVRETGLGERNGLLYPPDLYNPDNVQALETVSLDIIQQHEGILPARFEKLDVFSENAGREFPRLVVRFEFSRITMEQIEEIENLVRKIYSQATTSVIRGKQIKHLGPVMEYPPLGTTRKEKAQASRTFGFYLGPSLYSRDAASQGVFLFREIADPSAAASARASRDTDWFVEPTLGNLRKKTVKTRYILEVREEELFQTDLVSLITQVSLILANKDLLPYGELQYRSYNALNRLGVREDVQLSGLEPQLQEIYESLINPLTAALAIEEFDAQPTSILLIGYPGTGKTLLAKHLLKEDIGAFFVPIDPLLLIRELSQDPTRRTILPRLKSVAGETDLPFILHLEDVERMVDPQSPVNSALLNLMAGVATSNFYAIASTNYPEQLNSDQLLNASRFGRVIHFGLPDTETRYSILDSHVPSTSHTTQVELFRSHEEREVILKAIATATNGYTGRFLFDIANRAKNKLLSRIIEATGKRNPAAEDMAGFHFSIDDWRQALHEVLRLYDPRKIIERDRELAHFAEHGIKHAPIGFLKGGNKEADAGELNLFDRAVAQLTGTKKV